MISKNLTQGSTAAKQMTHMVTCEKSSLELEIPSREKTEKSVESTGVTSRQCKYGVWCYKPDCGFEHPDGFVRACEHGNQCLDEGCTLRHVNSKQETIDRRRFEKRRTRLKAKGLWGKPKRAPKPEVIKEYLWKKPKIEIEIEIKSKLIVNLVINLDISSFPSIKGQKTIDKKPSVWGLGK